MLNQTAPAEYIFATGKSHTLLEFVETAFNLIGRDWREHVTIDDTLMRPTYILRNKVDPSRAASGLGWKAASGMTQVVGKMLEAEMESFCKERVRG